MSRRCTLPATMALLALFANGALAQGVAETATAAGMPIWDFPDDDADRFSIAVLVGVGARDEDPRHAGIAHFLEHTLFLATGTHQNAMGDRELLARGLVTNGYTSHEVTVYHVSGRAEHWRYMVGWLADHVLNPRFDPDAVELERRIVLEEILTKGPDFRAITFEGLLYGDHPLARSIGGHEGTVSAVTTDDLRSFYQRHYHATNMAVGFSGRVPSEECMQVVQAAFADVPAGERPGCEAPAQRTGDLLVDRAVRDRTGALHLGYHLSCTETTELATMLTIGAHLRRRFFDVAREQRQLAYAPDVELTWGRDAQRLEFSCDTRDRGNVGELAEIAADVVAELQHVTDDDVDVAAARARGRLRCTSARDLAAAMELAAWASSRGGGLPELDAELHSMTPTQLATTARRHLVDDRRYSLSSHSLLGPSVGVRSLLFVLVIGAVVLLFFYGGRMRDRTKALLQRRRRPKGRIHAMPRRTPREPVDLDAVERDFQRMFEAEDGEASDRDG